MVLDIWDENVTNLRFVAWDTETTGSSPRLDHIVEIGAIAFDEEFEQRRFETLIKPPCSIPAEVVRIHGISDETVAGAPGAGEGLGRFYEFLSLAGTPRVLAAHNAGFDVGMVHGEHASLGALKGAPTEIVLDTCMLAKNLLPDLPTHRLEALVAFFKITPKRFHRAMADVECLREIFLKLLGLGADRLGTGAKGVTLSSLVDLAGGYFLLNPTDPEIRSRPFRLPPRISALESLCGSQAKVSIQYDAAEDARVITPLEIRIRGFKVYVEAFCHRDNIKKTFRADKILKIGKVDPG